MYNENTTKLKSSQVSKYHNKSGNQGGEFRSWFSELEPQSNKSGNKKAKRRYKMSPERKLSELSGQEKEKSQQEKELERLASKKINNELLTEYIASRVSPTRLEAIKSCSNFLQYLVNPQYINNEEGASKKVYYMESCGNRFCPICAFRQARKDALKISVLMKYIERDKDKTFVFITLTAPNVTGDKLKDEIDKYNKAFKKLMKRKEFVAVNKGYIRKLEVTYNKEEFITRDMWYGNKEEHMYGRKDYYKKLGLKIGDPNPAYDTYHPHFHVIMAVNKSYFKDRTYIKQEKLLDMWRDVMGDNSIQNVDIRRVKDLQAETDAVCKDAETNNQNESSQAKGDLTKDKHISKGTSINEISKYAAKDADMLASAEVFGVFYDALRGRQILTYNGLFAEANKLFKEKPHVDETGETVANPLQKYKDEIAVKCEYTHLLLYKWGKKEYLLHELRELTDEEKMLINKHCLSHYDDEGPEIAWIADYKQDAHMPAVPETATPEAATPETETPEAAAPQTEAPETETSEAAAPQTEAPETETPETASSLILQANLISSKPAVPVSMKRRKGVTEAKAYFMARLDE